MELDLRLRYMKHEDRGFISKAWVDNQRANASIPKQMGMPAWHRHYIPRISRYLDTAMRTGGIDGEPGVYVLCLASDEDAIIGWAASHGDVLDYVYVKGQARKVGNGTRLIEPIQPLLRRCSHMVPDAREYLTTKLALEFDPYAFGEVTSP